MRCVLWMKVSALIILTGALSGCGSFGGIRCDPNVHYPKDDPCYQDGARDLTERRHS